MKKSLAKYAWFSIFATIVIIAIKVVAYFVTGSVSLFSEAFESIINLIASSIALLMVRLAEKPPDEHHAYGHSKAEYFSSVIEGSLIFTLAVSVIYAGYNRLLHPRLITQPTEGIVLSILATIINLVIFFVLSVTAKKHHSITLEADAHYHLADIWTSVGAVAGVTATVVTKLNFLDPIIGFVLALHIASTGFNLVKRSSFGLMDSAIPGEQIDQVKQIIKGNLKKGMRYHGLGTRESGRRKFVSFHLLVPDNWSVKKGHDLSEKIEKEIRDSIEDVTVTTHLEPINDPVSNDDILIDRQ